MKFEWVKTRVADLNVHIDSGYCVTAVAWGWGRPLAV